MSLKDKIDALKASWNRKTPAEKRKIVLAEVVALALLAIGIAGIWFAMQETPAETPKEKVAELNRSQAKVNGTTGGFEKEGITVVNISETQTVQISGKPAVGFGFEYSGSPNAIVATFEANGSAEFDGKNIKFNLTQDNPAMDLSATNLTRLELNVAGSGCIFPGSPTQETIKLCTDLIDKLHN